MILTGLQQLLGRAVDEHRKERADRQQALVRRGQQAALEFRRVEADSKTSSQVNDEVRRALVKKKIEIASRTFEQDLLKDARIENFE